MSIIKRTQFARAGAPVEPIVNNLYGDQIYAIGRGKKYGAWIGGRSGLSTDDFIENPAYIIEDMARTAGLGAENIDAETFDAAFTILDADSWKMAGILDEQRKWKEIVAEIAKFCKLRVFFNNDNTLTCSAYDGTANFSVTGNATTPGDRDIYTGSPTLTGNRYDQHLIIRGTIQIDRTPLNKIINQIYIGYRLNYATGKFQREVFIKEDDSFDNSSRDQQDTNTSPNDREEDAKLSQTNYKLTKELRIDAPFIRDDATAVNLRNHIFDLNVDRRRVVSFKTYFNAVQAELCDIINIRHYKLEKIVFKAIAFTSGGAHQILVGDTLTGAISGATAIVKRVKRTSGTWGGDTAAGTLVLYNQTGTFEAENLDEGVNLNVATITSDTSGMSTKKWEIVKIREDTNAREIEIEAWELV